MLFETCSVYLILSLLIGLIFCFCLLCCVVSRRVYLIIRDSHKNERSFYEVRRDYQSFDYSYQQITCVLQYICLDLKMDHFV